MSGSVVPAESLGGIAVFFCSVVVVVVVVVWLYLLDVYFWVA